MKDSKLQFDRKVHVLYSKTCKKEIRAKIALHYPAAEQEAVWGSVQRQYADFLSDWRTDLGGKKNFHNGTGGTYDCIAIMSYYTVCKEVSSFPEIEEMEENLILPSFRKLRFVNCNRQRSLLSSTVLRILCPPCAMWTLRLWSCFMQGWYGRPPAWTAADATIPSAVIKTRI